MTANHGWTVDSDPNFQKEFVVTGTGTYCGGESVRPLGDTATFHAVHNRQPTIHFQTFAGDGPVVYRPGTFDPALLSPAAYSPDAVRQSPQLGTCTPVSFQTILACPRCRSTRVHRYCATCGADRQWAPVRVGRRLARWAWDNAVNILVVVSLLLFVAAIVLPHGGAHAR